MHYRTLSEADQKQLLDITASHTNGLRDHVILLFALKTGLRQHEILALDVGQVYTPEGKVRSRVELDPEVGFKGSDKRGEGKPRSKSTEQVVWLAQKQLRAKLEELRTEKIARKHDMSPDAPLFVRSHGGGRKTGRIDRNGRLAEKSLRDAWARWQKKLGWERIHRFHDLRHTAITKFYDVSEGRKGAKPALLDTKHFARHASIETTLIYTHATTEEEYVASLTRM